ncbi:MAG: triose-phosphate isomerase [Actinobacteria bacterium]|nr:MAG: triose-phosphate isomerase [Actinomycetota bacterium]
MGRTPLIAGNWKMYKTPAEAVVLAQDIDNLLGDDPHATERVEIVVCPPFVDLRSVATVLEFDQSPVKLSAQNVHWEDEGAFTGEVSPGMLADLGCAYCVVGHSERREYFCESDEDVNRKVHALVKHGITPIVCVGESLDVRDAGDADRYVREQVRAALAGVPAEKGAEIVIAYEPIWAIGTGRTPTPEAANDICRTIRATLGALFGQPAAISARVLYGGSAKPENISLFMPEPDIDGALIGGAALTADSFVSMARTAAHFVE